MKLVQFVRAKKARSLASGCRSSRKKLALVERETVMMTNTAGSLVLEVNTVGTVDKQVALRWERLPVRRE